MRLMAAQHMAASLLTQGDLGGADRLGILGGLPELLGTHGVWGNWQPDGFWFR